GGKVFGRRNATQAEGGSGAGSQPRSVKIHGAERWASLVQRHRVLAALASAAFILILAAPALAMKLSMPDESAQARGTMGYASYATMAQVSRDGQAAMLIAYPTTSEQDAATNALVNRLPAGP